MDIITEIQTNAHETPVLRMKLVEYFIANPFLVEHLPFTGHSLIQRIDILCCMPSELIIQTIRSALAKHLKRTLIPNYVNYKLHYELTITVPTDGTLEQLKALVGKVINSKMLNIDEAYVAYEKTEAGTPHAHMLLRPKEGKTIQASRLKKLNIITTRYSFSKVRNLHDYCQYLIKDIEKIEHIDLQPYHILPPVDYASTQIQQ